MQLKVLNAADMFGVRITVGRSRERAVGSDACHPLVHTAVNLRLN